MEKIKELKDPDYVIVIECARRPELGHFEPSITFELCPEWDYIEEINCFLLKDMRVMILGLDGYLGWTLALKLGRLGCKVSGIDNYFRRECVQEKGALSIVPIATIKERLQVAQEVLGIEILFREIDILDRQKLGAFLEEIRPEAIVHYAECPSAPYSMIDADHAIKVQHNNVIGTLGLLFLMKEIVPETSLIKLGTLGEYGSPLTGRPLFEGLFPADAVLKYEGREWSLGGELTPRDPVSFYHVCYDEETEVFTRDGWKHFWELEFDDDVLTWNLDENCVEYQKPSEIVKYDYQGMMYVVKHKKVDLKVTPNHRMIVGNKTRNNSINWNVLEAKEIESLNKFYKVGIPNWDGNERQIFTIPNVKVATTRKKGKYYYQDIDTKDLPMDDWLRFFAWFITEGCIYQESISKYRIQIAQKAEDEDELSELLGLIKRLGYHPNISRLHGKIQDVRVYDSQLGQYLKVFGKSNEKYIPQELKELSKRQLSILLRTMIAGDGTEIESKNKKYWQYYTSSKRLADDVQEIALKVGYSAILRKGKRRSNFPEYVVSISETINTQVNQLHNNDKWESHNGNVHCCIVDNGTLLVRRNGRPVWSGNSKVQDTFNVYEACKYWWLRSYDVMQGVIYGVHTNELSLDPQLRTRLDADEWFGTVVNRFVIQAILGLPLTVYGQGEQIRGFIALDDAMQCMVRLIASPPDPGQYDVVNQVSGLYKIKKLADTIAKVGNEKFGLNVKIQRVENPRVEADIHPFEVISKKLPRTFGFEQGISLEDEITNMFALLTQPHIKKRIEETAHVFWPVTRWDGEKRESEVIEVYTPGSKQNGGFQPQLDTGKELIMKETRKGID